MQNLSSGTLVTYTVYKLNEYHPILFSNVFLAAGIFSCFIWVFGNLWLKSLRRCGGLGEVQNRPTFSFKGLHKELRIWI